MIFRHAKKSASQWIPERHLGPGQAATHNNIHFSNFHFIVVKFSRVQGDISIPIQCQIICRDAVEKSDP